MMCGFSSGAMSSTARSVLLYLTKLGGGPLKPVRATNMSNLTLTVKLNACRQCLWHFRPASGYRKALTTCSWLKHLKCFSSFTWGMRR